MRLHNKLVVKKGSREFVSYNNILVSAVENLSDFKPYFLYLAIGEGGDETKFNQVNLYDCKKVYPLETVEYNFDPAKGDLFLTKKLEISPLDTTPLKIVEVGVCGEMGDNPKIANRFLANAGEPIYRDAGEEMSFEVTINLSVNADSKVVFTAGENPFVRFLLGDMEFLDKKPELFMAKGTNKTPNSETLSRDAVGLKKYPVKVTQNFEWVFSRLESSLVADLGAGLVEEVLLLMGDVVVARCNTSESTGKVEGKELALTADWDNMATINEFGVSEISSVFDETTGENVDDYTLFKFGTTFSNEYQEVCVGLGFSQSTERIVSKDGDKIGFIHDNTMDIFDFSGEIPVHSPIDEPVDMSGVYAIVFVMDRLILKYYDELTETFGVRLYMFYENGWHKRNFTLSANESFFPGVNANGDWIAMAGGKAEGDENKMILMIACPSQIYYWRNKVSSNHLLQGDYAGYNTLYTTDYIKAMMPSNRIPGARFVVYDKKNIRVGVLTGMGTYENITDASAVEIARDYQSDGYPRTAKNFIYAIDKANKRLRAYSIDYKQEKIVDFSTAERFFIDEKLEYIAIKEADKSVRLFYLDGSLNAYEFMGGLPSVGDIEIEDVEFAGGKVVVFFSDGSIKYMTINKNKFAITGVEREHAIKIVYSADNTPGLTGGNVRTIMKFTISS